MPNWLLPENIADVLPSEARKIEELRRLMLDNFRLYGYELVMPPLLEYLESLLTGAGEDTDLRTFKLVDQLSGRMLGLRPDMTTQVARIDAHLLNRASVTRLCYAGSVLHTRPSGLHATREPLQIGCRDVRPRRPRSRRGNPGTGAGVAGAGRFHRSAAGPDPCRRAARCWSNAGGLRDQENPCCAARQGCAGSAGADERLRAAGARRAAGAAIAVRRHRRAGESARSAAGLPGIAKALAELAALAASAIGRAQVAIDLADLRGYQYESGAMFALYVPGLPNAVARGGRYDHVGEAFGRARPATGFSLDLRELARLLPTAERKHSIRAPWGNAPELKEKIAELRKSGEVVIQSMPGHSHELDEFECDRALVLDENGSNWILKNLG
jgi:ATP phosphoribosyltransferase regulatory subunit